MKITKFITKIGAKFMDLRSYLRTTKALCPKLFFAGLYHLHDDFSLSSLNDKIGIDEFANMKKSFTSTLPLVNGFKTVFRGLFSSVSKLLAAKMYHKPIDENFIGGTYDQIGGVPGIAIFGFRIGTGCKSSFSVNYASHISNNSLWISLANIIISHMKSLSKVIGYVNDNIFKEEPQRLSERALFFREAIV